MICRSSLNFLNPLAISVVCGTICLGLVACSNSDSADRIGVAPERNLIDDRHGTYMGVGLGATTAEVLRKFGPTVVAREGEPGGIPLANGAEHGGQRLRIPSINGKPPRQKFIGYPEASFLLFAPQNVDRYIVSDIRVAKDGAATNRGVAIGDQLEEARTSYSEVRCATANEGTEYATYPFCAGRLGPDRYIWFGGDPIDIIEINANGFLDDPTTIEQRQQKSSG
jgi:hypothetical protein